LNEEQGSHTEMQKNPFFSSNREKIYSSKDFDSNKFVGNYESNTKTNHGSDAASNAYSTNPFSPHNNCK